MFVRISFLFLLCYFLTYTASANFNFNANCKTAYSNIISLKFIAGQTQIAQEKQSNPSNLIPLLLENYIDFLSLFVSEDEKQYSLLQTSQKTRLAAIENGDKKSPYYLYAQAEINIQWAFVKVKFGNYMSAATDINSAYHLLEKNQNLFPNFIPNKKSLGLLHVLIGSIPDQYKWVADIIGLEGNVSQGIQELRIAINLASKDSEYVVMVPECAFLLSYVLGSLESSTQDLEQQYKLLNSLDKTNLLLYHSRAKIAAQLGKNDDVIAILSNYPYGKEYFPFPYLDYLKGKALLNKLDPSANIPFQNFLSHFKGKNYIKASYQKLAWYYWVVKNDTTLYSKTIKNAISAGYTNIGEDKEALWEAQNHLVPNKILLKSRLLFDGGYYLQAFQMLINSPNTYFKPPKDELEFYYRLARIHHKMGNTTKAINLYKATIKFGEEQPYYYAAYAALQLATIYEESKNDTDAELYYKKCMSINGAEYEDAIKAKAKAGLNRLKKR